MTYPPLSIIIYFLDNLIIRLSLVFLSIPEGLLEKTLGNDRHKALVAFLINKRQEAGFTQAEFAKRLGEYQSFVARLESGQRRIDVIEFEVFASILGFDPSEFFIDM